MLLSQLISPLNLKDKYPDVEITSVTDDSRCVKKGALFIAVNGPSLNGRDFIEEAVNRGAGCIVSARDIKGLRAPVIKFADTRLALAILAERFFRSPSQKIKIIGVTGTNGKTTVTYLIESILRAQGIDCGIIGTIGYKIKDEIAQAQNTTPGALKLQELLRRMVDKACGYCIMEVSSHGLAQRRIEGIDFKAAIFTNLTQDHLDYHGNMENYFQAKAMLFKGLSTGAYAIINANTPYVKRLVSLTRAKVMTYGFRDCEVKASKVCLGMQGSSFTICAGGRRGQINSSLLGRYNIENILAACAFGLTQNIELQAVKRGIEGFAGVKGRLERVENSAGANVFIDYAHTPDGLKSVLAVLKQFSKGKLILVFGCGGQRDRLKRPLMGHIAGLFADAVFITSDNPRAEEPQMIADDIIAGMKKGRYKVILDRGEAIRRAISIAKKDDTVLIAGKGHENYQIFKDRRVEFDDRIMAEEALRAFGNGCGYGNGYVS